MRIDTKKNEMVPVFKRFIVSSSTNRPTNYYDRVMLGAVKEMGGKCDGHTEA